MTNSLPLRTTGKTPANRDVSLEIKFPDILRGLIDESPFKHNRKPIWQALNVTSAALSQYVQGQNRPRLETLVGLADFFGVSLDYLVRGRETRARNGQSDGSITRYVDWALADIQSRAGAKAWLVARIGDSLGDRIQEVADSAIADMTALSGVVTDEDLLLLESLSTEVHLMLTYLDYDLMESGSSRPGSSKFTEVVASNLRERPAKKYCFLFPPNHTENWATKVKSLRLILERDFGVSKSQLRNCQFRIANQRFMCGSGFYRLDIAKLRRRGPALFHVLEPFVSEDSWIGYVMHPNAETKGDILYDVRHLDTATSVWADLWVDAVDIT